MLCLSWKVKSVEKMIKSFQKSAMARTLEQAAFWRYPGKGATLVEQQAQQKAIRCKEELCARR
jgi:hypothetical protein